jgi:hypothetical protein
MDPGHSFLAPLEREFRDDEAERLRFNTVPAPRPANQPCIVGAKPTYRVIPEAS